MSIARRGSGQPARADIEKNTNRRRTGAHAQRRVQRRARGPMEVPPPGVAPGRERSSSRTASAQRRGSSSHRERPPSRASAPHDVSLLTAYALWLVGGWWGLHLFYLGREHQARQARTRGRTARAKPRRGRLSGAASKGCSIHHAKLATRILVVFPACPCRGSCTLPAAAASAFCGCGTPSASRSTSASRTATRTSRGRRDEGPLKHTRQCAWNVFVAAEADAPISLSSPTRAQFKDCVKWHPRPWFMPGRFAAQVALGSFYFHAVGLALSLFLPPRAAMLGGAQALAAGVWAVDNIGRTQSCARRDERANPPERSSFFVALLFPEYGFALNCAPPSDPRHFFFSCAPRRPRPQRSAPHQRVRAWAAWPGF